LGGTIAAPDFGGYWRSDDRTTLIQINYKLKLIANDVCRERRAR
jgi:hypothetical protein